MLSFLHLARYIRGTIFHSLLLFSTMSFTLRAHADWASDVNDHKAMPGICVFSRWFFYFSSSLTLRAYVDCAGDVNNHKSMSGICFFSQWFFYFLEENGTVYYCLFYFSGWVLSNRSGHYWDSVVALASPDLGVPLSSPRTRSSLLLRMIIRRLSRLNIILFFMSAPRVCHFVC